MNCPKCNADFIDILVQPPLDTGNHIIVDGFATCQMCGAELIVTYVLHSIVEDT